MAEIEESVIEAPPKRGRGRPKGSLNKKTIATREKAAEVRERTILDVAFEETPEEEAAQEPEELEQPEPEPEPEELEEEPAEAEEPEPPPPPRPKAKAPRVKRQPKEPKPVRMTSPEPPSYLDILKRGLDIAKHKQKAEKVARYDSFFQY